VAAASHHPSGHSPGNVAFSPWLERIRLSPDVGDLVPVGEAVRSAHRPQIAQPMTTPRPREMPKRSQPGNKDIDRIGGKEERSRNGEEVSFPSRLLVLRAH